MSAQSGDSGSSGTATTWDLLERLAKLFSLVAIPVVVAFVGWVIQNQLTEKSLGRDYVQLAVSILKEQKIDPALRSWAVDLLNDNAPTKFTPAVLRQLKAGEVTLPPTLGALFGKSLSGGAVAVSPDGRMALTGHADGYVRGWDVATGKQVLAARVHGRAVTLIVVSPDSHVALTAGADNVVHLLDLATSKVTLTLPHDDALTGAAFSPDGRTVFTASRDYTFRTWDTASGRLLGVTSVPAIAGAEG